jgi:hypothetical protein
MRHFWADGTSPYRLMTATSAPLSGGPPALTMSATSLKYWGPMSGARMIKARATLPNGGWWDCRNAHAPSIAIKISVAAPRRSAMSGWYSGESCHAFSVDIFGNSITTTRVGFQTPSRTSWLPPLVRYRPPKRSIIGATLLRYSSNWPDWKLRAQQSNMRPSASPTCSDMLRLQQ